MNRRMFLGLFPVPFLPKPKPKVYTVYSVLRASELRLPELPLAYVETSCAVGVGWWRIINGGLTPSRPTKP